MTICVINQKSVYFFSKCLLVSRRKNLMRKPILAFLSLFLLYSSLSATTYLKLWVNQAETDSMQQGQFFAWEYDVSEPGGQSLFQIYLDLNANKVLDEGDMLLEEFYQQDGDEGSEGPGDSSAVPDGLVYTDLGPFGLAPGNYLLKVSDEVDLTSANSAIHMSSMPNPTAKITGYILVEGIEAPNEKLKNIQIGAEAVNDFAGFWGGFTDQNGYYEINLPDNAIGNQWEVSFFFERQTTGYTPSEDQFLLVQEGVNSGFDFSLNLPDAYVYGDVIDDSGKLLEIDSYGAIVRFDDWEQNEFTINQGHFSAPAAISEGNDGDWFYLEIWDEGLNPEYLRPSSGGDTPDTIYVANGDSVRKDIHVYKTDDSILIIVTKEGSSPGESFRFHASSDSFGSNETYSNDDGYAEMAIKSGSGYSITLIDNPEYGTPLPAGYIIEGSPWSWAEAGDTVRFNLIPGSAVVAGVITFSQGDPFVEYRESDFRVEIADSFWTQHYSASVYEGLEYWQPVQNGLFSVRFEDWSQNFLAKPAWYANVNAQNDTTDNLNFKLNYRHAEVYVRLLNAPPEAFWEGFYINTMGIFPNVYQTEAWQEDDSTFVFNVCDGNWYIEAPYYFEDGLDTILSVSNSDSMHYIEFDYDPVLSLSDDKNNLPVQFSVKQNYPNPFNPQTTIEFALPFKEKVVVEIFDITGRLLQTLFSGELNAGIHHYIWNAENYASGLYFYKVNAGKHTFMNKLILLK